MANDKSALMETMMVSVRESIKKSVNSIMLEYVNEFATRVSKEFGKEQEEQKHKEKIIQIWNSVCSEFKIEAKQEMSQCKKMIKRNGELHQCKSKVSMKLGGEFCTRHATIKKCLGNCKFILKAGPNKDKECGKKASMKSKKGYCSHHYKKMETSENDESSESSDNEENVENVENVENEKEDKEKGENKDNKNEKNENKDNEKEKDENKMSEKNKENEESEDEENKSEGEDENKSDEKSEGCKFILKKGVNKNKKCGKKVSLKSQKGYCTHHLKVEKESE